MYDTMKRILLSHDGICDLDAVEDIFLADDWNSIVLSKRSGAERPLVTIDQIAKNVDDPTFVKQTLLSSSFLYLQYALVYASQFDSATIDFESIMEDMYQAMIEPSEEEGEEGEEAFESVPFPTPEIVSQYIIIPNMEPEYEDEVEDEDEGEEEFVEDVADDEGTDDTVCDCPQTVEDARADSDT